MKYNEFINAVEKLGILIDKEKLEQLETFYQLLTETNKVMNLTNITIKEEVYLKHFYDSLTIIKVIDLNKIDSLCDVGTGAGFPGIVLKIFYPQLKVVLIDSIDKRVNFLNEVINKLNLEDIEAVHIRAEDYAKNNRNKFDLVTSRAVANLSILTELCLPMAKIGGHFIAMKGHAEEELNNISNNLKILGSEIEKIETFRLPIENSMRTLIKIKKKQEINNKYPRNFKEIKKKPL